MLQLPSFLSPFNFFLFWVFFSNRLSGNTHGEFAICLLLSCYLILYLIFEIAVGLESEAKVPVLDFSLDLRRGRIC